MQRIFSVVILVLSLTRVDLLFGQLPTPNITITQADMEKAGTSIQVASIGEPVSSVILYPTVWVESTGARLIQIKNQTVKLRVVLIFYHSRSGWVRPSD